MSKVVGIILNILIAIVVIIILTILYSLIQTKILKKDYTSFFGYTFLQVKTGSMRNTLQEKDIILVKILNQEKKQNLKKDDIILYKQNDALVVHRIVREENGNFITKGDANNQEDSPMPKERSYWKSRKYNFKSWYLGESFIFTTGLHIFNNYSLFVRNYFFLWQKNRRGKRKCKNIT